MRPAFWVPLILFLGLVAAFAVQLASGDNPHDLPSALIDKPVPNFDLPPIRMGEAGLKSEDLKSGEVVLLNVFASWCAPCRIEHPFLSELAEEGIPVYGLNYKDRPQDVATFLRELGDPYAEIGADNNGRVGVDFGVYGVPETYVISGDGRIMYKHVGPILPQNQDDLRKAIAAARQPEPQ